MWSVMKEKAANTGFASDEGLMEAVSQGRHDALNILLDRYMSVVSRTSYRILCDQADSDYVTQKVFLKLWSSLSGYDGRYTLMIWIYRITCSLCLERLHRRKFLDLLAISSSVYEMSAPQPLSPEEDFITKETWEIFCRVSRHLSPRQRMVFVLCDLEGLTIEESGTITGLGQEQVKEGLRTARKVLRTELERYGKVR